MNHSEMRTRTKIYADDRSTDRFTSPEVTAFLNAAQEDIQRSIDEVDKLLFVDVETFTVQVDADAWEFTLPTTTRKVLLVESLATSPPTPLHYVDFRRRHSEVLPPLANLTDTDAGYAMLPKYFVRGNKVSIVSPREGFDIRVWFLKKVADLVGDLDTSEIPDSYHDLVCLQAARRAYGSVNRVMPQELAEILAKGLDDLVNDAQDRQSQEAKYVICEEDD